MSLMRGTDSGEISKTCNDRAGNIETAQAEITQTRFLIIALASQILEVVIPLYHC